MHAAVRGIVAGLAAAVLAAGAAIAGSAVNAKDGVAIQGHDPVAYFNENKPVKGSEAITAIHDGVAYRFATAANRDAFQKDPGRYVPQYGGYCAYGMSKGYKAPVDPAAFTVVDGKLYLNYSQDVKATWRKDIPGYVAKADAAWPTAKDK